MSQCDVVLPTTAGQFRRRLLNTVALVWWACWARDARRMLSSYPSVISLRKGSMLTCHITGTRVATVAEDDASGNASVQSQLEKVCTPWPLPKSRVRVTAVPREDYMAHGTWHMQSVLRPI